MAQPSSIKIKIKCLKSDDFEITIDSEASVDDLKEEIVRIRNIDLAKQRLIYKGRVLKSDKKLKDYKISDHTTVHLIVRKQAVTNPRNDEPTEQNSTIANRNNHNHPMPTNTTAISVAVVDGSNGAADVNSILNSVLSGFNGNINQQSLQNQIQSAMTNNPAHVMNLRGLLNPGDNPNRPNDDDVSSIDGDEDDDNPATNNRNRNSNGNNTSNANSLLPELQPQFAVSNGRGGYSPVTLLPPVLRSCNAINLEIRRLQKNYNRDVMGIKYEADEKKQDDGTQSMNVDPMDMSMENNVEVEMEVQTIVADRNGNILSNVLSNNLAPISPSQPQPPSVNNTNSNQTTQEEQKTATATQPQPQPQSQSQAAAPPAPPRRREYLSNLLDSWDSFNEVVFGLQMDENIDNEMDEDNEMEAYGDEEMKGNNNEALDDMEYKGVMGFIDSVFDELVDYQNSIESGLNNEIIEQEAKEEKEQKEQKDDDDDNDMEMQGNEEQDVDKKGKCMHGLKGYRKDRKDVLKKKVESAGNMLVEIGTVLASLGHMINKMDLHRKTTRNRLRITGLSNISHVVRTAVPVEISTIVSRGINIGQQFQQMRQMANAQQQPQPNAQSQPQPQTQPQPQPQPQSQPPVAISNNNNNEAVPQANSQQNTNTIPPLISDESSANTTANTANTANNNDLLSSLLDSFAGSVPNQNENTENAANMEVDNDNDNNTTNTETSTQNSTQSTNNNRNPMSALLNAFANNNNNSARGGSSNPLASLMSAFTGGGARGANRNSNNRNDNNNNDRNPLMLINRTLKFMIDTLSMSEINEIRNGNYSFIRNYRNILSSFMLNTILTGNDTPMRRHEIAMDYANGFGLFIISQFSNERRDAIRSLTLTHFRNNTPLLIDIILDSNNEIMFEEKLINWIACVYSSWIYKLSLQYRNKIEDVKKLLTQILINASKYLYRNNNNILNNLQVIAPFVGHFVDSAKSYHLKEMAKQHGAETNNDGTDGGNNSNTMKRANKKQSYGTEQWVMNVEETERNRWLDTIKCDQKRMKQCLSQMKAHKFSESYLPPNSDPDVNENKKKGSFKKNNDEQKNDRK